MRDYSEFTSFILNSDSDWRISRKDNHRRDHFILSRFFISFRMTMNFIIFQVIIQLPEKHTSYKKLYDSEDEAWDWDDKWWEVSSQTWEKDKK